MKYMGSKNRIAKHILPIMLANRKPGQAWVEPFVGGANMIDKVGGRRIGNDSNRYLIALLKAVQDGWRPPTEVSREMYKEIRANKDNYDDALVGFVGFLCSFGSKWFGGYAFDNNGGNYALVGHKSLCKQAEHIKGVDFFCGSYLDLVIPENSLVYCDPPYENTTSYKSKFNHGEFWQWCRDKSDEGHTLFVSEYSAPRDFDCLISIDHYTVLNKNNRTKRTEKLFTYRYTNHPVLLEQQASLFDMFHINS